MKIIHRFILFVGLICCLGMAEYHVPPTFFKETQQQWDDLLYTIERSPEQDFVLLWEGFGGRISMAWEIFDRIKSSKKHITIRIVGDSISAHALVTCYLHDKVDFQWGSLVLHNAWDGRNSDGTKRYDDDMTYRLLRQCESVGVLTHRESEEIVQKKLRLQIYPWGQRQLYPDFK